MQVTSGTVSVTNGSTTVTGSGTSWSGGTVSSGDILVDSELVISHNVSNSIHSAEGSSNAGKPAIGIFVKSDFLPEDQDKGPAALRGFRQIATKSLKINTGTQL